MASSKTCFACCPIRGFATTISASRGAVFTAWNAPWKSGLGPRTSRDRSSSLKARAAASYSLKATAGPGPSASQRIPTRDSLGSSTFSNSTRFALKSRARWASPVIFPPGCAKLSTYPAATGSTELSITIGIVLVASLAARITTLLAATITSTFCCTTRAQSRASDPICPPHTGVRSGCFYRPHNRDRVNPCRNASNKGESPSARRI